MIDRVNRSTLELILEESEAVKRNLIQYPFCSGFANNAVATLSAGITGYKVSRKSFGFYNSQVNVSLTLALLSALRQHEVQSYQNLRLATEHVSLAAYALHHPDDPVYLEADSKKHETFLKTIVYPWLSGALPIESKELKQQKASINSSYSHGTILQSTRIHEELEGGADRVRTHFLDQTDGRTITSNLIHVGQVAFTALMTIAKANVDVKALALKDGLKDDFLQLRKVGFLAVKERDALAEVSAAII